MDRIHWDTNHSSSSHDMNIWNNEEASKESTPEASSLFLFALFEFFFEPIKVKGTHLPYAVVRAILLLCTSVNQIPA